MSRSARKRLGSPIVESDGMFIVIFLDLSKMLSKKVVPVHFPTNSACACLKQKDYNAEDRRQEPKDWEGQGREF